MREDWFFATGLVFCTTILLIVAILWYNIVVQVMDLLGVLGSSAKTDTPVTDAPEPLTGLQWLYQILITLFFTGLGIVILWGFHPYGTAPPE